MDPLTQGILGAAVPQATASNRSRLPIAGALGFLAGMAADLDILIQSDIDPLLYLAYHRHFTHSLIFIPIGGLLCALVFHWIAGRRWNLGFRQTYLFCTLGYATHALLDAATSYGTLLLWPFSNERVSWSIIAVVDPLFTLPFLVAVVLAAWKKTPRYAVLGLAWAGFYLSLGILQHVAALGMTREIAAARGHSPIRLEVKPSFGNILVWKTIYEADGVYYVDAVRAGLGPRVFEGTSVPKLDIARDLPWLDPASQQARDIERFRHFSQDFIALDPEYPSRVIDVRYSMVPNDVRPLWSIELSPKAASSDHVSYLAQRLRPREGLDRLLEMAFTGAGTGARAAEE